MTQGPDDRGTLGAVLIVVAVLAGLGLEAGRGLWARREHALDR